MLILEANVERKGILRETLLCSIHLDGERIGSMSTADEFTLHGCLYHIKQRRIGKAPQSFSLSRRQREFGYICDAVGNRVIVFCNNHIRFQQQRFRLTRRWLKSEWRIVQGGSTDIAIITRTAQQRRTASANIVILADGYEQLVISSFLCLIQSELIPSGSTTG